MKRTTSRDLLLYTTVLSAVSALPMPLAWGDNVLPKGGQVTVGQATIAPKGANLTVTQGSNRAVIDWSSFSVGAPNTVTFTQPSSTAAILNRVTGTTPTSIAGQILANGQVFLVNPNGIAITGSGGVKVGGGFVASTLDINNADFTAGKLSFQGDGSSAAVSNAGRITTAPGGFVGLLGGSVSNAGTIEAPLGTVGLGSGERATLDLNGDGFLQVAIPTDSTTAQGKALLDVAGSVHAAGGRIALSAASVAQAVRQAVNVSGELNATAASGTGGDITLTGGSISLTPSSRLLADGAGSGEGGHILVKADGTAAVQGYLSAQGGAAGGNGGQVETSGESVDFTGVRVNTLAAHGATGTWLVDPTNLIIDATAANTINTDLATTSVTLQTSASGAPSGPAGTTGNTAAGNGDILINAPLAWSSSSTLTLDAYNAINVNAPITIGGAGGLVLDYNTSSPQNLLFAQGAGVNYGATNQGGTLAINGQPYALLYTMSALPAVTGNSALATSLDASGTTYSAAVINQGSGVFEGLGNTISNLTINSPDGAYLGLFGNTTFNIRDLGLVGGSVTGGANAYVGSLAGELNRDVYNVYAKGTAVTGGDNSLVGGLVGLGLANGSLSISNVYATGAVSGGNGAAVGGLIGAAEGPSNISNFNIKNSYATGAVSSTGTGGYFGGLVGISFVTTISNSYATGAVSSTGGAADLGGLIGGADKIIVSNSYATGAVSSTGGGGGLGGLIGGASGATISDSYATGAVSGSAAAVGGLAGVLDSNSVLNNVYSTGAVSSAGFGDVGGLLGEYVGTISNAYWDTQTSGTSVGVGLNTSSQTVTGLTTAQLQGGSANLGSAFAGGTGGLYPYLASFYPDGVQAISGIALPGCGSDAAGLGGERGQPGVGGW